jgi:hypothetical protein
MSDMEIPDVCKKYDELEKQIEKLKNLIIVS